MKTLTTPKTTHEIPISDSIWEAFELMASDMGTDRNGLINQAMFMFARLNGYLTPSSAMAQMPSGVPLMPTVVPAAARDIPSMEAVAKPAKSVEEEESEYAEQFDEEFENNAAESSEPPAPESEPEEDDFLKEDVTPEPPPPPPPARRSGNMPASRRGAPPPPPSRRSRMAARSVQPEEEPEEQLDQEEDDEVIEEGDDRKAVAERVLETAAELERLISKGDDDEDRESMPRRSGGKSRGAEPQLYIINAQGEEELVEKDRYVIGRGKHCDKVVNSGKVSREHAAITREDGAYFIEDLGSSNGTWFHKQRIKKQQIEDGDEFFICSEKVQFSLR